MTTSNFTMRIWTANNLKETIEFYTKNLGFNCETYDKKNEFVILYRDSIRIGFIKKSDRYNSSEGPSVDDSYCYNINNVDELWEEFKNKVEIIYPIRNEDDLKEFAIKDNNQRTLIFVQDV